MKESDGDFALHLIAFSYTILIKFLPSLISTVITKTGVTCFMYVLFYLSPFTNKYNYAGKNTWIVLSWGFRRFCDREIIFLKFLNIWAKNLLDLIDWIY